LCFTLFFKSGHVNCSGTRTTAGIGASLLEAEEIFRKKLTVDDTTISSTTWSGRFPHNLLNIPSCQQALHDSGRPIRVSLRPSRFPGGVVRSDNHPTLILFRNGKYIVVGGQKRIRSERSLGQRQAQPSLYVPPHQRVFVRCVVMAASACHHPEASTVEDHHTGDVICGGCGLVLHERQTSVEVVVDVDIVDGGHRVGSDLAFRISLSEACQLMGLPAANLLIDQTVDKFKKYCSNLKYENKTFPTKKPILAYAFHRTLAEHDIHRSPASLPDCLTCPRGACCKRKNSSARP
jgi:hypothetical protein